MLAKIKARVSALLTSKNVRTQVARFVRLFAFALAADPVASALIGGRSVTWVMVEGAVVGAAEVAFRKVVPVADLEAAVAKALAPKK